VVENARRKAAAGAELAGTGEGDVVLGVDTDVAIGGRLLGKAADEVAARERLAALSGRSHEVLSGVVVLGAGEVHGVARTEVRFRDLTASEIDLYVASGEWRDRAGAYAIQGLGSILIDQMRGDFSNVVGLPVALLLQLAPNILRKRQNPKAEK
jgi:septum formation protein